MALESEREREREEGGGGGGGRGDGGGGGRGGGGGTCSQTKHYFSRLVIPVHRPPVQDSVTPISEAFLSVNSCKLVTFTSSWMFGVISVGLGSLNPGWTRMIALLHSESAGMMTGEFCSLALVGSSIFLTMNEWKQKAQWNVYMNFRNAPYMWPRGTGFSCLSWFWSYQPVHW